MSGRRRRNVLRLCRKSLRDVVVMGRSSGGDVPCNGSTHEQGPGRHIKMKVGHAVQCESSKLSPCNKESENKGNKSIPGMNKRIRRKKKWVEE